MNTEIFSRLDRMVVRRETILEGTLTRVELQGMSGRRRGEDSSMRKLGRLLGETDEDMDMAQKKPVEVKEQTVQPVEVAPVMAPKAAVEEEPKAVTLSVADDDEVPEEDLQEYVSALLEKEQVRANAENLKHHIEHIVMIRLGRMIQAHTAHTRFSLIVKYTKIKTEYRKLMEDLVKEEIIDEHDSNKDIFSKLDAAMAERTRLTGEKEHDTLIQMEVSNLLQQTKVPISQNDLIYHMEHDTLIQMEVSNLLQQTKVP